MTAARNITPEGSRAEGSAPLLLAPEIWGEPVVERECHWGLGTVRWGQLDGVASGDGARASTGVRSDEEMEELLWLAPCSELAPPPSGKLVRYPHDRERRWSWAHAGLLSAVTAAATFAIALTCFAVADGSARRSASRGESKGSSTMATLLPVPEPIDFTMEFSALDEIVPEQTVAGTSTAAQQGASGESRAVNEGEAAPEATAAPSTRPRRRARPATRRAARRAVATEMPTPNDVMEIVYTPSPQRPEASPNQDRQSSEPVGMFMRRDELMPRSPTTVQVRVGLRGVARLIRNCSPDGPRQAPLTLTISGDTGRVSAVRLGGPLGGTLEGDCVERALGRARFPRFAEPTHQLSSYPLVLR